MASHIARVKSWWVGVTAALAAGVLGFLLTYSPPARTLPAPPAHEPRPAREPLADRQETVPPASPPRAPEPAGAPAPAATTGRVAVLPPPSYHPRDPSEWQGMLIDMNSRAQCDTSARCGLAMACQEGLCGPCADDSDCSQGEVCALDHCVRQERAECRTKRDCAGEELCTLSGYSSDTRGNQEMVARCTPVSGQGQEPEATELVRGEPTRPPDVSGMELLEQVRAAADTQ